MKLPAVIAAVAAETFLVAFKLLLDRAEEALGPRRTNAIKEDATQGESLKPDSPACTAERRPRP